MRERSMEITLTPDIERALLEQALRRGTTPEQLALESLRQQFVPPAHNEQNEPVVDAQGEGQGTLADFRADFIGVLHSSEHISGGARMSESTTEAFGQALIK